MSAASSARGGYIQQPGDAARLLAASAAACRAPVSSQALRPASLWALFRRRRLSPRPTAAPRARASRAAAVSADSAPAQCSAPPCRMSSVAVVPRVGRAGCHASRSAASAPFHQATAEMSLPKQRGRAAEAADLPQPGERFPRSGKSRARRSRLSRVRVHEADGADDIQAQPRQRAGRATRRTQRTQRKSGTRGNGTPRALLQRRRALVQRDGRPHGDSAQHSSRTGERSEHAPPAHAQPEQFVTRRP